MTKRSSTPTDENALAKWIVDTVTIETEAQPKNNPDSLGRKRLAGRKGGDARAEKLSKRIAGSRKDKRNPKRPSQ